MVDRHPNFPQQTTAQALRAYAPLIAVFALLIIGVGLFMKYSIDRQAAIEACVERGVNYYKNTGSYPRFKAYPNAGRRTEDVVREKCMSWPDVYSRL